MSNVMGYGLDTRAVRKRVLFQNTNSSAAVTIYEGMPFCYQFDTTNNVSGWDKENDAEGTTTAEGYHNEGKFLIVDLPDSDNIHAFAGVVASGGWCGKTVADDGELWLDVYIPNGAVVPVRTDQACTVGRTILSIHAAEQHLTGPYNTAARPVAIAAETLDCSSAAALILAKLDSNMFLYQMGDATTLNIDDQDDAQDFVVNKIKITSAQTSGMLCALWVQAAATAGANSGNAYGMAIYAEADVSGSVSATGIAGSGFWLNLTGGTQTAPTCALQVGLYEDGATVSSSNIISILQLTSQFADNPAANNHAWLYLENNGTYAPDVLIRTGAVGSIGDSAMTGDHAFDTADRCIAVRFVNATYYIPLMNNKGD